jgi:L-arabinonolactonase
MPEAITPDLICKTQNLLGECVLWDHRTQQLQWTDIESSCLWQWDMTNAAPRRFELPQRLGSFALTQDPEIYVGAFENGFAHFSAAQSMFEMRAPVTQGTRHLRMNDGRTDRNGVFWAGSMAQAAGSSMGSLWRFGGNDAATAHLHDIHIPNSLCWNGAGDVMYFADSPRNIIWAYDFDAASGPTGEPRIFAQTPPGIHPDGSCIDAQDHLWNAQWGGGEIVRYRPDGSIERRLPLPVSQPSCVAFAGPNLDQLCITTARVDLDASALSQQPLAGALLVYNVGVTGLREDICVANI